MNTFSKALWHNPCNVSAGLEEADTDTLNPQDYKCTMISFVHVFENDSPRMYVTRKDIIDYNKSSDESTNITERFFTILADHMLNANPDIRSRYEYPYGLESLSDDEIEQEIIERVKEDIKVWYDVDNHRNVYTIAAPYLKMDSLNLQDTKYNWEILEKVHYYKTPEELFENLLTDIAALQEFIPNAFSESVKDAYTNVGDAILDIVSDGYMFVRVWRKDYSAYDLYLLDDVLKCIETGEIEFVQQNSYILAQRSMIGNRKWHFHFTTPTPSIHFKNMIDVESETGIDPYDKEERRSVILEGEGFRNTALGIAAAAGLFGGYNNLTTKPTSIYTPAGIEYIQKEPQRKMILSRKKPSIPETDIVGAKTNTKAHLVKFINSDGKVVDARGLGNLSSRINNPGNLVVNNMASAQKIGAIGIWKGSYGNYYAIFPSVEAGEHALISWWEKDSDKYTVREMLERFAPRGQNNLDAYAKFIESNGVPMDVLVAQLTDGEFETLIECIKTYEGFYNKPAQTIHKYIEVYD
jgi:hypothetical protein